jgi:hypothetical protein
MGFLDSIGKAIGGLVKGVGDAVGSVAKGIGDFLGSPFGKLLVGVGLTVLTGGVGGLGMLGSLGSLGEGLGALGSLGSAGQMLGTFGSFASTFLGPVQGLLSGSGLSSIAGFLQNAGGSGDLLSMATSLLNARQSQPPTDPSTEDLIRNNLLNMFAFNHARALDIG